MKNKPHILLTPEGRWTVHHHKVYALTNYPFPYTAAVNFADVRNLKEGR